MPSTPPPSAASAPEQTGDSSRRPLSAFLLYAQDIRPRLRQENPSLSSKEIGRLSGSAWREAPDEVKRRYKQKAALDLEQFKRDHPSKKKKAVKHQKKKRTTKGAALDLKDPAPVSVRTGIPTEAMTRDERDCSGFVIALAQDVVRLGGWPEVNGILIATLAAGYSRFLTEQNENDCDEMRREFRVESFLKAAKREIEVW
jgi:hypothetical protein